MWLYLLLGLAIFGLLLVLTEAVDRRLNAGSARSSSDDATPCCSSP